jgi:hypothetical protein
VDLTAAPKADPFPSEVDATDRTTKMAQVTEVERTSVVS